METPRSLTYCLLAAPFVLIDLLLLYCWFTWLFLFDLFSDSIRMCSVYQL